MSDQDYNAGYRGNQFHHGMDRAEYDRGKSQKDLENTLAGNQKVEVPGVAYTLILVSPFLFLVYPALGFTILAAMGATAGAMALFPEEYFYWIMFIGFILGVCSFFPGLALEAKASQFRIYQHFRTFWRIFNFLIWPVILVSIKDYRTIGPQSVTNASGEALFMAIIITIIVHFVMRTIDRLYFPNLKEAKKILAMQEKGEPLKRNLFKRLFYGFLWIVPVVCALNVAIRLIVGAFLESEEIASFYKDYSVYIYVFDTIAWYLLCLGGILPGTAKTRKSFIDHSKLAGVASLIAICLSTGFINATPAAAQGFSGHYNISQGVNPDGSTYGGHVVVEPRGDGVYYLLWKFPGASGYKGVGLLTDGVLGVGWSDRPGYGVVIYKVKGGNLTGEWLSDRTNVEFGTEILEGPPGLNGVYDIVEAYGEDHGNAYSGSVEIRPNGEAYDVTWTIGYEVYTGAGLLKGDLFIVGWGEAAGVVFYEKDGNGLKGIWAAQDNPVLGREILERIAKKK